MTAMIAKKTTTGDAYDGKPVYMVKITVVDIFVFDI